MFHLIFPVTLLDVGSVLYNFPPKQPRPATKERSRPYRGVAESVSFDHSSRDIVYLVIFQKEGSEVITDEVSQNKLAHAANCPVGQ